MTDDRMTHSDMTQSRVLALLRSVAADVWDERPLSAHIRAVAEDLGQHILFAPPGSPKAAEHAQAIAADLTKKIADLYGYEESDGSYSPEEFLDMTGWFWGVKHVDYVARLRDYACEVDPKPEAHQYGRARVRRSMA